ncbi:hypothetical protein ACH4TV_18025 [Streptomyces sp. NPDC020898]|uniref:hypothetical protein n=1 Tax=Streptomyces sp. NPDC020898 TaxID=3365101 RepID=UPI003794B07F
MSASKGIASGADNAIREVGRADLTAVFSAQGGYESASTFMDGLIPALWAGAGTVALAVPLALLMLRQRKADGPATGLSEGTPAVPSPPVTSPGMGQGTWA